jgi:hypothetical protein
MTALFVIPQVLLGYVIGPGAILAVIPLRGGLGAARSRRLHFERS